MKHRFAVVWFNPFFGINKFRVHSFQTLREVWVFVDRLERDMKSCGYVLNFRLQNLQLNRGEEYVDQTTMQDR